MKDRNKLYLISITTAIYIVVCLILQPISFGPIQFRISELLSLLAINFPFAIIANALGCFIANLLFGLGIIDAIFGSIASLIACYIAYYFRNKIIKGYPIVSMLFIVIINAIIVGLEMGVIYQNTTMILIYMLQVALSEFIVIFIIGLPIYNKLNVFIKKHI